MRVTKLGGYDLLGSESNLRSLLNLELLLRLFRYSCPGVQRGNVHISLKDLTT